MPSILDACFCFSLVLNYAGKIQLILVEIRCHFEGNEQLDNCLPPTFPPGNFVGIAFKRRKKRFYDKNIC